MKNLVLAVLVVFLGTTMCLAQFRLNTNPKDPNRVPKSETEFGVVLSHNSPCIIINGANNIQYTNYLTAGVLVIADKQSGNATWVAICGNDILTKNWKPEGKVIYFDKPNSYQFACEDMLKGLEAKLDNLQEGVDELLERPSLQEALRISTTTEKNCWTTFKTGTTIIGAGVGFVAGGYGFRTTSTKVIVIPGIRLQTGDGTIKFGPEKVRVENEKKFNTGAAVACGVASGVITYLLNRFVF